MNPHIYDALTEAKTTIATVGAHKVFLPKTSSRKSYNDYEEITIPKVDRVDLLPADKLVSINDNFDAVGRAAFSGCTHLNQMQSIVYDAAYNTNKNLLIAAPTGAGKTNVAMMATLHELKNYFKPGTTEMVCKNISQKFKIIYIAPMKSLATEQTENFNTRLKSLGIKVRELTGDISLTEYEISQTHIIVTTPEKWDVVTRKSKGDVDLLGLVRLIIIDEVHLLQSDRGPVLEAIVARTLRYVESSQKMTRIVGLSATLPNYVDIAMFLKVNPQDGLFYFDNRFRPVPLMQKFIGVRQYDVKSQSKTMDKICYNQILHYAGLDKQVMIFVHTRNSTKNVAMKMKEMIHLNNKVELFEPDIAKSQEANRIMANPRNKLLKDLFAVGFGVHHAGMIRQDRLLVEKLFRLGALKVLVCTSTLAWGVNFPAHAVIIRGTEIYDASVGKYVDVGLLDVMQIFGRAGRPQYDTEGHAVIITALEKMDFYLKLLTNQTPIESNFIKFLTDNLNAEVVSGTVSSIAEGMEWLRYTYLNIRIGQNPLVYGFEQFDIDCDPSLATVRKVLLEICAQQLDSAQMCTFDPNSGRLEPTVLGRIASHFYINFETVTKYNELMCNNLEFTNILSLIGEAQEFEQIKFREEEAIELGNLRRKCHLPLADGAVETTSGKVNCLLQAHIGRLYISAHSLVSDMMYIAQNSVRIARGLFEYSLKRSWSYTALNILRVCKMFERQQWYFQTPLRHFDLPDEVISRIESNETSIEEISELSTEAVAKLVNFPSKMAQTIKNYVNHLPYVVVEGHVKPINMNLLVMSLSIEPYFKWNERYHGQTAQHFWMWIYDAEITEQIYYSELIRFSKEEVQESKKITLNINLPLIDNTLEDGTVGQRIPNSYNVYLASSDWNGCDYEYPIECLSIFLPQDSPKFTSLPSNLERLPLSVLKHELYMLTFQYDNLARDDSRYTIPSNLHVDRFNTIQSQVFFPVYHTDKNILICAPAGSGKTLIADIAIMRVFSRHSKSRKRKIVYLNTNDVTISYKTREWRHRFHHILNKNIGMFTGNINNDLKIFEESDLIVSSTRNFNTWLNNNANSIQDLSLVSLFIYDDLQLIGDPIGAMMELVVAQLKLALLKNQRISFRQIGLSNSCANHQDLADWIDVKKPVYAYNFDLTTTRPVQLISHVSTFPERFYSPRMAMMNKPIFKAIMTHSPTKPVMVFVSSAKQCNLTATDLLSCLVNNCQASELQWLHLDPQLLGSVLDTIEDETLRLTIEFGIGIMHPGLNHLEKQTVGDLYTSGKIQVLICTQNYAMGSAFRAYLVIVKGTERYDPDTNRMTFCTPNQVMQMMGRAGRPEIDSSGMALLFISDIFEEYYKKFMQEPFPIESDLLNVDSNLLKKFLAPEEVLEEASKVALLEEEVRKLQLVELQKQKQKQNQNQTPTPTSTSTQQGKKKKRVDSKKEDRLNRVDEARVKYIKNVAIEKLTATLFFRRLEKNPSYYTLSDSRSKMQFLHNWLDSKKYLFEK